MSETEKQKLLAAVRKSSEESRETVESARRMVSAGAAARAAAVRDALNAGVPRQEIADAAGTHRNNLYKLVHSQEM